MSTSNGRLQEFTIARSTPIKVDPEKGILYDVLFLGHRSRNGADYSQQVMKEALPMYEGALSYSGHTRDGSNPDPERAFGVPRNCHVAADGIRGDYHFPPKHRLAEDLVWRAQNAPNSVGFSHDSDCTWAIHNGRKQVSKINRVFSVDYVTKPATTSGLFTEEEEPAIGSELLHAEILRPAAAPDATIRDWESAWSKERRLASDAAAADNINHFFGGQEL